MEIGHHIGNKGRVIEREVDMRTGQQNEHKNFIGMSDREADLFDNEWQKRTGRSGTRRAVIEEVPEHPAISGNGNYQRKKETKKPRKYEYYVEEA